MCAHVTLVVPLNVELKTADAFWILVRLTAALSMPPHPPSTNFPSGSPSLHPLRTAYARGCGAEAAARVGA